MTATGTPEPASLTRLNSLSPLGVLAMTHTQMAPTPSIWIKLITIPSDSGLVRGCTAGDRTSTSGTTDK